MHLLPYVLPMSRSTQTPNSRAISASAMQTETTPPVARAKASILHSSTFLAHCTPPLHGQRRCQASYHDSLQSTTGTHEVGIENINSWPVTARKPWNPNEIRGWRAGKMGSSEAFGCCGRDGAFEGRTARDGETRPDCEDDGAAVPGVREAYYTCGKD